MNQWQMTSIGEEDGVFIFSTDSATIDWLITEIQKRDPGSKSKNQKHDQDGSLFYSAVKLSRGQDSYAMKWLLERLLCEQGWEPYSQHHYAVHDFRRLVVA